MEVTRQKHHNCFLYAIVMQNIQVFYKGPVTFPVTYIWVAMIKNECSLLDRGTPLI